jgi:biotin carboxylase
LRDRHVFIAGLDPFNEAKLRQLHLPEPCRFHALLSYGEVRGADRRTLHELLTIARDRLTAWGGPIDAIVGYWDFPVTALVALLIREHQLIGPSLEAVLRCEHKYWSRIEHRKVIQPHTPPFAAIDPFDDQALTALSFDYPFWLKPVKSYASQLAFRIRDAEDYQQAIARIRRGNHTTAGPFSFLLTQAQVPDAVRQVDGRFFIAEQMLRGRQCTLEGYIQKGQCETYGIVDSFRYPNRSTFFRYQYPSTLPVPVKARMQVIAQQVIPHLGLDDTPFNIEFFFDPHRDQVMLLEINPRISQSHSDLFEKVDGQSNHQILLHLAMGWPIAWRTDAGPYRCAAKFFLRRFQDAIVQRVPTADELRAIEHRWPGTRVLLRVQPGTRLRDLPDQDSYSYELAYIYLGAPNQRELLARYRQCVAALPFAFAAPEDHALAG